MSCRPFQLYSVCSSCQLHLSQDGEPVEFSVVVDKNGRSKAENVTGPMGAFVQGAPRRPRFTNDDGSFGGNDFGGKV